MFVGKVSWGVSGQTLKFRPHFSNATSNCKENSTNTEQHYLTLPAQNFDLKFPVTSQRDALFNAHLNFNGARFPDIFETAL